MLTLLWGFQAAMATEYQVVKHPQGASMLCPAGTWKHQYFDSGLPVYRCVECAAGKFKSPGTKSPSQIENCTLAGKGYYVPNAGSAVQTQCPVGTYSESTGRQSCTTCPVGKYAAVGSASCKTAGNGYYASADASQQIACQPGYFAKPGSTSCTAASAGYYAKGAGASTQTECAAGTYSSERSANCSSCPDNTYSGARSASCSSCSRGYEVLSGKNSCTAIIYKSPGEYFNGTGNVPGGTKKNKPHICDDRKNWNQGQQKCT